MNTKILETLEFNKIKTLFEPHLLTEQGLEELKGLAPTAKVDKIKQAFTEMEEMQALFVEQPHFTILATRELSAVCKRLEMGADLNIEEFLLLKRVLLASRELQSFYDKPYQTTLGDKFNRIKRAGFFLALCLQIGGLGQNL